MWRPYGRKSKHLVCTYVTPYQLTRHANILAGWLTEDLRAWCILQAWACGMTNPGIVLYAMDTMFGDHFVLDEWADIFDPMTAAWDASEEESNFIPKVLEIFEEAVKHQGLSLPHPHMRKYIHYFKLIEAVQNEEHWISAPLKVSQKWWKTKPNDNDIHAFDFGVIDLTMLVQDDDSTRASPLEAPQKCEADIICLDSLSQGPLQQETSIIQCSLTPMPGPSNKRRRDAGDQTIVKSSKAPHKWRKMVACHSVSHFLDLAAFKEDEDSNDEDEEADDGDLAMNGPSETWEVVRGGREAFSSHLDDICHQYEENAGHNAPRNLPHHSQSTVDSAPIIHVYKLNILLGMNSWTLLFFYSKSSYRKLSWIYSNCISIQGLESHSWLQLLPVHRSIEPTCNYLCRSPEPPIFGSKHWSQVAFWHYSCLVGRLHCGGGNIWGCDMQSPHLPAGLTSPVFCKADFGGSRSTTPQWPRIPQLSWHQPLFDPVNNHIVLSATVARRRPCACCTRRICWYPQDCPCHQYAEPNHNN